MYNRVILIGRLTAGPELRVTPNGVTATSFRLAVNRPSDREKADFFTVVAWRHTAEFLCRYFSKGKAVGLEGQIHTVEYTDKSGNRRQAVEIVAERAFFVEKKDAQPGAAQGAEVEVHRAQAVPPADGAAADSDGYQAVDGEEDLPF